MLKFVECVLNIRFIRYKNLVLSAVVYEILKRDIKKRTSYAICILTIKVGNILKHKMNCVLLLYLFTLLLIPSSFLGNGFELYSSKKNSHKRNELVILI